VFLSVSRRFITKTSRTERKEDEVLGRRRDAVFRHTFRDAEPTRPVFLLCLQLPLTVVRYTPAHVHCPPCLRFFLLTCQLSRLMPSPHQERRRQRRGMARDGKRSCEAESGASTSPAAAAADTITTRHGRALKGALKGSGHDQAPATGTTPRSPTGAEREHDRPAPARGTTTVDGRRPARGLRVKRRAGTKHPQRAATQTNDNHHRPTRATGTTSPAAPGRPTFSATGPGNRHGPLRRTSRPRSLPSEAPTDGRLSANHRHDARRHRRRTGDTTGDSKPRASSPTPAIPAGQPRPKKAIKPRPRLANRMGKSRPAPRAMGTTTDPERPNRRPPPPA